jgi:sigma-B regulation protein RsbU (phosphoserine phosphatase)
MEEERKVTVSDHYLRSLEKKVEDLNTLIEVSSIISSTLDFDDLITLVMEKAKKVMNAEACSILLYNRETNRLDFALALCKRQPVSDTLKERVSLEMGQGIAGWVAKHQKSVIVDDAARDSRFYQEADDLTGFSTKSILAAPLIGRSGLIGVAEILNSRDKQTFDRYDLEIFQTHCRQVAIAIENALFHKASIEREKLGRELEIASVLQKSFLPASPVLEMDGICVEAVNIPASQVGGDLYDFVELGREKAGVLIGDVSGKGVFAALYMAKVMSEFRHIARVSDSPELTLRRLNDSLLLTPRGMFFTCIYVVADTVTGNLEITVAGHPPVLKISGGYTEIMSLPAGPPLGILPAEFPAAQTILKKGERLLLLTDGVYDAKDMNGRRVGFERIVDVIKDNAGERGLIQRVIDYVDTFSRRTEKADDITLVEIIKN